MPRFLSFKEALDLLVVEYLDREFPRLTIIAELEEEIDELEAVEEADNKG